MKYGIVDGAVAERVGDELVITLPGGDLAVLNESAELVLEAVRVKPDDSQIAAAAALESAYDLEEEKAMRDARRALGQLRRAGVAVPARSPRSRRPVPYRRVTRRTFAAGMAAAGLSLLGAGSALGKEAALTAEHAFAGDDLVAVGELGSARFFTDSLGREVEVPVGIKKVAPYGPYAQALLESIDPDLVVQVSARGMHASVLAGDEDLIAQLAAEAGGGASLDALKLDEEAPDLVLDIAVDEERLCTSIDAQAAEDNVPVAHFVIAPGELSNAYRALGKLLGRQDRCEELADYVASIDVTLAQVREQVSEKDRKRVYFGQGVDGMTTRGSESLVGDAIAKAGCCNVSAELEGAALRNLSACQIENLRPDMCLIYLEDEVFDGGKLVPAFETWSERCLGSGRQVFRVPDEPTGWLANSPLLTMTLGAVWVAWLAYPEICGFSFETFASDYFQAFFGVEISKAEAEDLATGSMTGGE